MRLLRKTLAFSLATAFVLTFALFAPRPRPVTGPDPRVEHESEGVETRPSDWFGMQRAFPFATINQEAYRHAVEVALVDRAATAPSLAAGLAWEEAGPFNIGGRVTALAVAPGGATVYLGSANGGVFKSTDSGTNWTPIFDQTGVSSIGALALDPTNPYVVYCGTGEANASVDSYDGNGVYKSTDAGATWQPMGLAETRRIGRVAVDPSNPNRVFVAAMGTQFSTGPHRGLYRSLDAGLSWTKVLFVNDSTGVSDVVINPAHPETVFCATWERVRHPTYRRAYGPGCGIWRSIDSGTTWTRLQIGLPAPSDNVGRIGLAIAPSRPSWIYAQIISGAAAGYVGLGLYRSTNGGASWTRRDVGGFTGSFGGFGWYFGEVQVDPANPDQVYCMGVDFIVSADGGANFFTLLNGAHVDQHAIWIDPSNSQRIYLGNDGGFFRSTTGGASWFKSTDLPITQFYAGTIDPSNPARLLGGTQDNNTLLTPGGPGVWQAILGGDGFWCIVDPVNPSVIFAEYQYGAGGQGPLRSEDGGSFFFGPSGIPSSDRFNWSTPFVMNPRNHNTLLVGSQRVHRSRDNGLSYVTISPDLTTNNLAAQLVYSTLTTLEIAPSDTSTYYTGSDDGKVYRTTNGGASWTDVSAGLPVRWVTRVAVDPNDAQVVYVTLSGFGQDEPLAHVYRSVNGGASWSAIAGNLPDVPVNDLIVDPANTSRLFIATDIAVYVTNDLGGFWYPLGLGMPLQAVHDLTLHAPSRTLVAATHGRSQWRLDLGDLPLAVDPVGPRRGIELSGPAPNPSHGETRLALVVPARAAAEVAVFDAAGRRVRQLHRGPLEPGRHDFRWDGRDAQGRPAAAGVYYVRASQDGAGAAVKRLVRISS